MIAGLSKTIDEGVYASFMSIQGIDRVHDLIDAVLQEHFIINYLATQETTTVNHRRRQRVVRKRIKRLFELGRHRNGVDDVHIQGYKITHCERLAISNNARRQGRLS